MAVRFAAMIRHLIRATVFTGLAFFMVTDVSPATGASSPKAELKAKALSISNMPTGWSVDNSPNGGISGATGCLARVEKLDQNAAKGLTREEVKFTDGQFPTMSETLVTGKPSAAHYSQFLKDMNTCRQVSISGDGVTFTGSIGQLSFPSIGSTSTHAWTINLSAKGVTVGLDLVLFKVGSIGGDIVYGDYGSPDVNTVQGFVTEAVNKIQGKPVSPVDNAF